MNSADNIMRLMGGYSEVMAVYGVNLIMHSTLIILSGFIALFLTRKKKAAFQSLLLRACLIAVLVSPFVTLHCNILGLDGFHLPHVTEVRQDRPSAVIPASDAPSVTAHLVEREASRIHSAPAAVNATPPPLQNSVKPSLQADPELSFPAHVLNAESSLSTDVGGMVDAAEVVNDDPGSIHRFLPFIYGAFCIIWIGLSLFVLFRAVISYHALGKIRRFAVRADKTLRQTCRKAADDLGIEPPEVFQSDRINNAFLAGLRRPAIYMPMNVHESSIGSRDVFLHELAHMIRGDNVWNYFCNFGIVVLPFQPLIWILIRKIHVVSDFACDDYVVTFRNKPHDYAVKIFAIAQRYQSSIPSAVSGTGLVSDRSPLKQRIIRILDSSVPRGIKLRVREILSTTFLYSCALVITGFAGFRTDIIASKINTDTAKTRKDLNTGATSSDSIEDVVPRAEDWEGYTAEYTRKDEKQSRTDVHPVTSSDNNNKELWSFGQDKPGVSADTKHMISHDLDSIDTDGSPAGFGFYRDNREIPGRVTFASSVIDGPEKEVLFRRRAEVPEDETHTKSLFNGDEKMFDTIAHHLPVAGISGEVLNRGVAAMSNELDAGSGNTLKTLKITIPIDYEYGDQTDPERTRMSEIYRSLRRSKLYPAWSPDGQRIAFNDKDFGVWVVNADGGEPRLIFDNYYKLIFREMNLHYGELKTIGFSPDGKEVAYRRYVIDQEYGTRVVVDDRGYMKLYYIKNPLPVIESVNIETLERRVLAENTMTGCWSPDGQSFAYITQAPELQRTLWLLDITSGSRRQIPSNDPSEVCFGNDGSFLLVTGGGNGDQREIRRIDLDDGMDGRPIVTGDVVLSDLSPDGRWMLYSEEQEYRPHSGDESLVQRQPMLCDMLTGEQHSLPVLDGDYAAWGRFSPDGESLCFNIKTQSSWDIFINDFIPPAGKVSKSVADVPAEFSLKGNFPNPFNMSTTIEYAVAEEGDVSLVIYNSLGQKVRELLSDHLSPGVHTVVWDGVNDDGNMVSTGTYIVKLSSAGRMAALKMSLVK